LSASASCWRRSTERRDPLSAGAVRSPDRIGYRATARVRARASPTGPAPCPPARGLPGPRCPRRRQWHRPRAPRNGGQGVPWPLSAARPPAGARREDPGHSRGTPATHHLSPLNSCPPRRSAMTAGPIVPPTPLTPPADQARPVSPREPNMPAAPRPPAS
jgi:hypothetical protein